MKKLIPLLILLCIPFIAMSQVGSPAVATDTIRPLLKNHVTFPGNVTISGTLTGGAGAGVSTFNGRAGAVIPLSGDYTGLYMVIGDSVLFLKFTDTTLTLETKHQLGIDTTSGRAVSDGKYTAMSKIIPAFHAGLIDTVKTSDTVEVGWWTSNFVLDTIQYSGGRTISLVARLEAVDSLYQTTGATLLDTTTVTTMRRLRSSAVTGGSFTPANGKLIRMVFPSIATPPKEFLVTLKGHRQ